MLRVLLTIAALSIATVVDAQSVVSTTQTVQTANAAERSVTVAFKNVRLPDAIKEISHQANVPVMYSEIIVPSNHIVTYSANSVSAGEALRAVLRNTGVVVQSAGVGGYRLARGAAKNNMQGAITGRVLDSKTGKGVSGASVSIDNDTRGVFTGNDGVYRIAVVATGNHTVVVRLVGYAKQTKSVVVGESTLTIDFKLEPSASVLDQVVVTGTIVQSELRSVPNAITVITAKQIEERGITRIDQLFRGDIPGLFAIEQGTNSQYNEVVMFSRGATNINISGMPADITNPIKTYVDGVEMSSSKYLSQIDPKSIERIEILTGPQASTIYGANALNGVMQIFTKRGGSAKPSINLSLLEGWSENNFSSALAPSHNYDGSIMGTEGKFSYNMGLGWDYIGAWSPGKQVQRTSAYGSGRYQSGPFTIDASTRQGWTDNRQKGSISQIQTALRESGEWFTISSPGLSTPVKVGLSGRTFGLTFGFIPLPSWSHQLSIGNDASNTESIGSAPALTSPSDTAYSNSRGTGARTSQSYSSTVRITLPVTQVTLTYGADHWRNQGSATSWVINRNGSISFPSITRFKQDKNSGVYAQAQVGFRDALFFTYGLRTDWNPNYGERARVRPGRYGVSYTREFGNISTKIRGSYGRSIKPPGLDQKKGLLYNSDVNTMAFYGAPFYQVLPNPELGAEFQQGGEGGIELYFGTRASLVVTRYNQTVDGLIQSLNGVDSIRARVTGFDGLGSFIDYCFSGLGPTYDVRSDGYCYYRQLQYLNVGAIRNQGWEAQNTLTIGALILSGTYTWNNSRIIGITSRYRSLLAGAAVNAFLPGQTFNYVPERTFAFNAAYALKQTSLSLNINGVGVVFRDASAGNLNPVTSLFLRLRNQEAYRISSVAGVRYPTAGYITANMNASHRFSHKLEATLQITNLTNYYQNDLLYSYPVIGRSSKIGARIKI